MVIGASDTFEDRVLYEDTIAGLLRSGGTEVLTSHEHFARDVEMNRANVEPVVSHAGSFQFRVHAQIRTQTRVD